MKTLIAATALIASVASASAMTNPSAEIERYVGAAEAASLTEAQVLTALSVVHSGDTEGEKRAKLRALVK